jgi:hypothetical protein
MLLAAIENIHGSVQANDNKSSAVLVLQGVLLTGVLTLTSRIGPLFNHASANTKHWLAATGSGALASFLLSVGCLLLAIYPYSPGRRAFVDRMRARHPLREVWFPHIKSLEQEDEPAAAKVAVAQSAANKHPAPATAKRVKGNALTPFLRRLRLLTDDGIETELGFELIKAADIRDHEAFWTKWGLRMIGPELIFLTAFFAIIGTHAVTRPPTATPPAPPTITWKITSGGKPLTGSELPPNFSNAQVTVSAGGTRVRRLEVWKALHYFCVEGGSTPVSDGNLAGPASAIDVGPSGRQTLQPLTQGIVRSDFRCPPDMDASTASVALTAQATDDAGGATRQTKVVYAPLRRGDPPAVPSAQGMSEHGATGRPGG